MNTGTLITFEGGEGGGKTTQIALIKEKLLQANKTVITLREPGGTNISEQIREVVLATKNTGMIPMAEVLLFQAARAQIYGEIVIPALEKGSYVLMDRSRDSSVVYQGIVRGFGKELIENLNDISTQKTYPKMTILLDVEAKIGLQRQSAAGGNNRMEMENITFHENVRQGYLQLAKEDMHHRWKIVNANQPFEAVTADIWKIVQDVI